MNSGILERISYSPKSSTKNVNKFAVKIDWPKSVMKPKSQDGVETRGFEKENTDHRLVASNNSHNQQVKIGDPSKQLDRDSIIKRPLLDHQRLSSIQSHRYKPYETARRFNSIPGPTSPTSGLPRNSHYSDNSGLVLPKKSNGIISVSSSLVGPALMPPPSRSPSHQFLATGNVSLNSTIRPNSAFKQPTSTHLQSSSFINQKNSYPLAGKGPNGVSTASVQVIGSAGVSSETQFRRLDSTKINGGSSKDDPVVETQKLSQTQDLNLSTASCPAVRSRGRPSISKKRAQEQLIHHLNDVIDTQEILYSLSTNSQTRKDFLDGAKGAPRLAPTDLEVIETIHRIITSCKRPKTVNEFILNQDAASQQASEHFKLLMEGRDEIPNGANVSYLEGKLIIQRVLRSGYFRMKRYNANVKLEFEK